LRDHDFRTAVVVPYLRDHLEVTMIRVKFMAILVSLIFRGQVFCRKVLLCCSGFKVLGYGLGIYPAQFLMNKAVDFLICKMP
jgi:hypothetical protein